MRSDELMKRLDDKLKLMRRHGVGNVTRELGRRMLVSPLLAAYGTQRWHNRGFCTTNYKKIVVAMARQLPERPDVVVEVGCGLGDLVSRVRAGHRFGYDIDAQVVACARVLQRFRRGEVIYRTGSIDSLEQLEFDVVDLLITIGWLHVFTDEWIQEQLRALTKTKLVRYVLVDEFPEQRGRIETTFKPFGDLVAEEFDPQDRKSIFLFRCEQ
jgi:hypothetical protein